MGLTERVAAAAARPAGRARDGRQQPGAHRGGARRGDEAVGHGSTGSCTRSASRRRTPSAATSSTPRGRAWRRRSRQRLLAQGAGRRAAGADEGGRAASIVTLTFDAPVRVADLRLDGRGEGGPRGDHPLPRAGPGRVRRSGSTPSRPVRSGPWPARASPASDARRRAGPTGRRSGWNTTDATPVGRRACFLLSDWRRGITGELIHVDGGYHAMGATLPTPAKSPS